MLAAAMNAGDWISAVLAIVQIAAIIIGAAWAYWKFAKGRIFHRRAEPRVAGALLTTGASHALRATVAVENTGSAGIPLRVVLLTVSAYGTGEVDEQGHPVWRDVARALAFLDDKGDPDHIDIESQETINDDVVIPIPAASSGTNVVAYRITCHVFERRKEGGGICWTTKAIVPVEGGAGEPFIDHGFDDAEASAEEDYVYDPLLEQRPADEAEIQEAEGQR
jgi:hypothetical protein